MHTFHTTDDDLPGTNARAQDQARIDQAVAEFLAAGNEIRTAGDPSQPTPTPVNDAELVEKLAKHSADGKTLSEAAKALKVPEERCRRLAVEKRIPFRTKSFLKKRSTK
ncbi:hypothetical protein ACIQAL_22300 [Pseudomonas sp. NPDC088368]|uniref:hypothetical protein n=1 Tax=Pseudomonas sp. NPDC088368 TaxID=3364453 RepID=UPI0037F53711